MPTPQEVFDFIETRIAQGYKSGDAYEEALQEFSKEEVAVSTLRDVLGARAFGCFFTAVHASYRPLIYNSPEENKDGVQEPFFHEGADRVLSVAAVRLGILDLRFRAPGFGDVKLRDFTKEHALAYAEYFNTMQKAAKKRRKMWTWLAGQLGSKRFEEVYTTEEEVQQVLAKMRRAGMDE